MEIIYKYLEDDISYVIIFLLFILLGFILGRYIAIYIIKFFKE